MKYPENKSSGLCWFPDLFCAIIRVKPLIYEQTWKLMTFPSDSAAVFFLQLPNIKKYYDTSKGGEHDR